MSANIKYRKRAEIDAKAWDRCITNAANGLIYVTHGYLDDMAMNWDGLVLDDYKAVMPLVWRRKWGFYYLYYPPFIPALGVFGSELSAGLLEEFLKAIPSKFRYWDFPLNPGNLFEAGKAGRNTTTGDRIDYAISQRINYILPLNRPYAEIQAGYRENLQRNLQKAKKLGCIVKKQFPVNEVIELAKEFTPSVSRETEIYTRFENLYIRLHNSQQAITYGICSEKGKLLASAVFLHDRNRAYYLLVGNHPDGKTLGASHSLIDAFIQDNAGQDILLDFEGSDIRNLAFFYSGYGAVQEYYPVLKLNRLPKLIRPFKQ